MGQTRLQHGTGTRGTKGCLRTFTLLDTRDREALDLVEQGLKKGETRVERKIEERWREKG
jgi:hypothetical protein